MVTEILVKESISGEMIESGRRLTEMLLEKNFDVAASFWFFVAEAGAWRMMIASSEVDKVGPLGAYEKLQILLREVNGGSPGIDLIDITVLSPSAPLTVLLRSAIRTGKPIQGIRFSQGLINGQFIEDAYIYRLL